jgi:hypothetical protein
MKKPYIIAIDDDLSVLRAVERDLKAKFSSHYRVFAAESHWYSPATDHARRSSRAFVCPDRDDAGCEGNETIS